MVLVANDQSWAVCMPKKTASQSLVLICKDVATVQDEWHGCTWNGNGRRYMVVRNPYERLSSMYWYVQKNGGFCHGLGNGDDWLKRFVYELNSGKSTYNEWILTQSHMANIFKPHLVFKLEDGLNTLIEALKLSNTTNQFHNITKEKTHNRLSFDNTFSEIPLEIKQWIKKDSGDWY